MLMSEDNINRYKADIAKIQQQIESLKVQYSQKHDLAIKDKEAKINEIKTTKGVEVENIENDLNAKKTHLLTAEETYIAAKEAFKEKKQVHKEVKNNYIKALTTQEKNAQNLLKNIDSELNRETKLQMKEIKNLQKMIQQEEKAIAKSMNGK